MLVMVMFMETKTIVMIIISIDKANKGYNNNNVMLMITKRLSGKEQK